MTAQKIAATTFLTIAATAVTAATAYGQPAPEPTLAGADRGISYSSGLSADGTGVTTKISDGSFGLSEDRSTVTVTGKDGTILARLPMTVAAQGHQVRLNPEIASDATTLTLRPADQPAAAVADPATFRENVGKIQEVSRSSDGIKDVVLLGCVPGLVVGGLIGGIIGAVVGALLLIIGAVVTLPLAILLGATLGCLIA
ncbi:hypothetical protein ACWIGW_39395 [Nocardia brasiliensis]